MPTEAVTHLAVAFDNPIRSFRNDLFPGYKSDEGVPPELRAQFDAVEEAVRALGVVVWSMREHEADDGARHRRPPLPRRGRAGAHHDARQGSRSVPARRAGGAGRSQRSARSPTRRRFRATRGFGPGSMPDFLALTGDTADGIPGLPGFGEKSASMLLGAYEHLENIPAAPLPVVGQAAGRAAAGRHAGRAARGGPAVPDARDAGRRRAAGRVAGRPRVSRACPARGSRPGATASGPAR